MNLIEYYRARKRYYSMLIYTRIYSDKKNPAELESLRSEFEKIKEEIDEDQLPLYERILDLEDMLLNCDEEEFKRQFEAKSGKYFSALLKREELYRTIFEKTKVIVTLYSVDPIRRVIISGSIQEEVRVDHGEYLEPLLNYIDIYSVYIDGKLIGAEDNRYEVILSPPYKYLVRKDDREKVERLIQEIERVQSKLQLEIALRQIEEPDEKREEDFRANQEYYLKLRSTLDNYDVNNLVDKVRTIFKKDRVEN
ncbi:MAG: hypothetical protein NZ908_01840 [Candidatus Micrarchaeota archaeon]|nr:hypothetical protein [Candidatus Micrarchaeota archaeon]MCX8154733.1 hypothetical protein [Candidatus Micrarchaeota archaeon]